MARTPTKAHKKVRRPRRLRWIIAIFFGLLLGVLAILFFSKIYNPFGASLPNPLVLVPEQVDFVLTIPDFPEFLGEIRDQGAVKSLDSHRGFQDFLKTRYARDNYDVVDTLRSSFRKLDDLSGRLPLGLKLLGDVSGQEVTVCGYFPDKTSDDPAHHSVRWMAIFQPESWKAIAGVNVLMDESLYGWFVKDELERTGAKVEHQRDTVTLTFKGNSQPLHLTRIANTLLVSTESRQLARIRKIVESVGLPESPALRFSSITSDFSTDQVRLIADRKKTNGYFSIENTLLNLWGPENLSLAEANLPRFGGEDLRVGLSIGSGIEMSLETPAGEPKKGDIASLLRPFSKPDLQATVEQVEGMIPEGAFGMIRLSAPLGELLAAVMARPELMSSTEREQLSEALEMVKEFKGLPGFFSALENLAEDRVSIVFFKQPRRALEDKAAAGFALIASLRDQGEAQKLLDSVADQITEANRRTGGQGVKELFRQQIGPLTAYKPLLPAGAVDDDRVTEPGIGLIRGRLILTNYHPWLLELPRVADGTIPSGADSAGLSKATSYAPSSMLVALLVSGQGLKPYLEQSASGWAWSKTTVTQLQYSQWRTQAKRQAMREGLISGRPKFNQRVLAIMDKLERNLTRGVRPQMVETFRERIQQLGDVVDSFGFFVQKPSGGPKVSFHLGPK